MPFAAAEKEVAMRLIAITPPYFYAGEAAAIADALDHRGFWRVHIRKPGATEKQMAHLLKELPAGLRDRVTLHDCFDLAAQFGVGGLHCNSRNPHFPAGWNGVTSRSIHSVEEIAGVKEDYAFLSPVYPSISKPGYRGDFDLAALKPHLSNRIFALGGVVPQRLPDLENAGFGGAAMLGAAWSHPIDLDAFGLQFITHPTAERDVVAGAAQVLSGGCRWVQLRHKDASTETLELEGRRIADLCRAAGAVFIVDDHVELVSRVGADGVHLGKNDMPVAKARSILGPGKIIGATANTFADIEAAARDGADYIGLGPFRFTTTKKNLSPMLGLEGYRNIMQQCRDRGINLPVVAIGGITEEDIPAIMQTGVSGIAVSSTILGASNPAVATSNLLKRIADSAPRNNRNANQS